MRAVVFDYYFTLAQPTLTDFSALSKALGCVAGNDEIERHRRELLATRPLLTPVFDGQPDPFRTFRDYWQEFGDDLFQRLGVIGGGHAYADNRGIAHQTAALYPDVPPVLDWIRQAGLPTGVLSDADRDDLTTSIAACGLGVDAVVCSENLACYKPHRSCFEAICSKLGVEPKDAMYVGDSPLNDIEGSRRAGLRAVWLNRRGLERPNEFEPPKFVAHTLEDIRVLLE